MVAYILDKISKKNTVAIVLAGGIGGRVKSRLPKQFLPIRKKPLLFYSIELFLRMRRSCVGDIIVLVPDKYIKYSLKIIKRRWPKLSRLHIIAGGSTRVGSYFNATKFIMDNLPNADFVVANDAARPLVNVAMVKMSLGLLKKSDIGLLAAPLEESLFRDKNKRKFEVMPLDRNKFFYGQTPYSFKFNALTSIYERFEKTVSLLSPTTDIISLANGFGAFKIKAVRNPWPNFKITYQHDFLIAEQFL